MDREQILRLIHSLSVAVLLVDTEGVVHSANTVAREQLGLAGDAPLSVAGLLGAAATEEDRACFLPSAGPARARQVRLSAHGARLWDVWGSDIRVGGRSYKLVSLSPSGAAAHDEGSQEASGKRAAERFELAIDAARIGVFDRVILGPRQPLYWSPSMRKLLGYDLDAEPDPGWFLERVHEDDRARMIEANHRASHALDDGRVDIEVRWHHPEGGLRDLNVRSLTWAPPGEGQLLRSIGVVLDVTERERDREALNLREELLEATSDLLYIFTPSGVVRSLNRAARDFHGLEGGARPSTMAQLCPEDSWQEVLREGLDAAARSGHYRGELTLSGADGAHTPVSVVLLPHYDRSGTLAHYSLLARDLTEQKRLEEQFQRAQRLDSLGRLAGGVAHDLNNMLSVVASSTDFARESLEEGHPARSDLLEIEKAVMRAASLTGQLLAYGRRQVLRPSVVDLNTLLLDIEPMARRVLPENIEIRFIPAPRPVRLLADPGQLTHVLMNLMINARDAMPGGGSLIVEAMHNYLDDADATRKIGLSPGEHAVIAVSDTGEGMSPEVQARIFEPFFTTKAVGKGTGLGLASAYGIVRQSKGGIWVYSEEGQGSTFKIYLPAVEDELSSEGTGRERAGVAAPQWGGGTVLVAEDEEQVRASIARILRRLGCEVLEAGRPSVALELAASHRGPIDLLVTDVVMPGMTGRQLSAALEIQRPELRTLFVSGYTENTIVHSGVLDDGVAFLAKPIWPAQLLEAVDAVMAR